MTSDERPDGTRLDLLASDWLNAVEDHRRRLRGVLTTGAALYPTLGSGPPWPARARGTIYGTRREAPEQPALRDEEITMTDERATYHEALREALNHAREASRWAGSDRDSGREKAITYAAASRAWSAVAGLLRVDETRADAERQREEFARQLREQGLTPTGRRRHADVPPLQPVPPTIREPEPPLSTSLAERGQA